MDWIRGVDQSTDCNMDRSLKVSIGEAWTPSAYIDSARGDRDERAAVSRCDLPVPLRTEDQHQFNESELSKVAFTGIKTATRESQWRARR